MLTKGVIRRIDLPAEPGEWIEVRLLSWRQLAEAKEARSTAAIKRFGAIGDELKAFQGLSSPAAAASGPDRPEDTYDLATLLNGAIVSWSYPEPVTPENIDQLDTATVDVILAVLLPSQTEADRKNGSLPSIVSSETTDHPLKDG